MLLLTSIGFVLTAVTFEVFRRLILHLEDRLDAIEDPDVTPTGLEVLHLEDGDILSLDGRVYGHSQVEAMQEFLLETRHLTGKRVAVVVHDAPRLMVRDDG